jgi:hypothetical protein
MRAETCINKSADTLAEYSLEHKMVRERDVVGSDRTCKYDSAFF